MASHLLALVGQALACQRPLAGVFLHGFQGRGFFKNRDRPASKTRRERISPWHFEAIFRRRPLLFPAFQKQLRAIHNFPNRAEEVNVRQDAGTKFERTSK